MDVNGERGANLESCPHGYEDVVSCKIYRTRLSRSEGGTLDTGKGGRGNLNNMSATAE